jgi:hypothetical protein
MCTKHHYYDDPHREADSCAVCEICFGALWAAAVFGVLGFLAGLFV